MEKDLADRLAKTYSSHVTEKAIKLIKKNTGKEIVDEGNREIVHRFQSAYLAMIERDLYTQGPAFARAIALESMQYLATNQSLSDRVIEAYRGNILLHPEQLEKNVSKIRYQRKTIINEVLLIGRLTQKASIEKERWEQEQTPLHQRYEQINRLLKEVVEQTQYIKVSERAILGVHRLTASLQEEKHVLDERLMEYGTNSIN